MRLRSRCRRKKNFFFPCFPLNSSSKSTPRSSAPSSFLFRFQCVSGATNGFDSQGRQTEFRRRRVPEKRPTPPPDICRNTSRDLNFPGKHFANFEYLQNGVLLSKAISNRFSPVFLPRQRVFPDFPLDLRRGGAPHFGLLRLRRPKTTSKEKKKLGFFCFIPLRFSLLVRL